MITMLPSRFVFAVALLRGGWAPPCSQPCRWRPLAPGLARADQDRASMPPSRRTPCPSWAAAWRASTSTWATKSRGACDRPIEIEGTQFSGLVPGLNAEEVRLHPGAHDADGGTRQGDALHRRLPGHGLHVRAEEVGQADRDAGRHQGHDDLGQQGLGLRILGQDQCRQVRLQVRRLRHQCGCRAGGASPAEPTPTWPATPSRSGRPSRTTRSRPATASRPAWCGRSRFATTTWRRRNEVSMAIKCMKSDGTLAKLHEKWFGEKPAPDSCHRHRVARAWPARHHRL